MARDQRRHPLLVRVGQMYLASRSSLSPFSTQVPKATDLFGEVLESPLLKYGAAVAGTATLQSKASSGWVEAPEASPAWLGFVVGGKLWGCTWFWPGQCNRWGPCLPLGEAPHQLGCSWELLLTPRARQESLGNSFYFAFHKLF